MDERLRKLAYLERIGVQAYARRDRGRSDPGETESAAPPAPPAAAAAPAQTASPTPAPLPATPGDVSWQPLEQEVRTCRRCSLCETRTQTVFGVGAKDAEWMLIGEAPGFEEDKRGEPFVGRAGKLLDRMLQAIGFARGDVYIANTIKCRPPDNRNPTLEEIAHCSGYLKRQIELIQPKIILLLGGVASAAVLGEQTPVGKMRGRAHVLPGTAIPVIVTYHPAYLLRAPQQKRAAWDDLQLACRTVGRELP